VLLSFENRVHLFHDPIKLGDNSRTGRVTCYTPRNEVGGILDSACPSLFRVLFLDIFWINFSDIEMKLGMIGDNDVFMIMSYRSNLSFVVIDQYLTELWALGLGIFMKISVFRTFS
jgi:hypothetical protein